MTPEQISEAYRSWYAEQGRLGLQNEPLYPGVVDLLKELKTNEWLIGIATNKSLRGLSRGLQHHEIEKFFSIIMTTDNFLPKPNKAMAVHALQKLKIQNSEAFMIGDTVHDIKMGKNAKINTIAVTWGYNTQEELYRENADHIIDGPSDLLKILGKY